MTMSEYFIIPEVILTLGIIFVVTLSLKKATISNSKLSIEIGSLKRGDILKMLPGELKNLRKIIVCAAICLFAVTLGIAIVILVFSDINLVSFAICILTQIIFFILCGIPFLRKIKTYKQFE